MNFPIPIDTIEVLGHPLHTLRDQKYTFLSYNVLMSLRVVLILANSQDPDEMQLYAAFHLRLHCLTNYLFKGFLTYAGLKSTYRVLYISFSQFN